VGLPSSESVFETHRGKRVSTVVGKQRSPAAVTSDLKEALAQDGDAIVVCDLRGMTAPGAAVAQMFTPVSGYLDHWPGSAVVVCSEDGSVLTRLPDGAQQRLLVRADRSAGVTEVDGMLPPVQQARIRLPADPSAARQARMFATNALEEWQVPESVGTATLVVSELVTNSIRHAQTINELTLSLAQKRLRIAVHDLAAGSPRPTRQLDADALDGRGLFLVDVMSRAWGVFPSTLSGKTVWAILDSLPTEGEQTLS
jgi:anti-sigma regulatory factor (Ser/Thr protein kinase)